MPGSVSRTARVSALAIGLVAAGVGVRGDSQVVEPARGMEAAAPETFEAAAADGPLRGGGVSDADDWLG